MPRKKFRLWIFFAIIIVLSLALVVVMNGKSITSRLRAMTGQSNPLSPDVSLQKKVIPADTVQSVEKTFQDKLNAVYRQNLLAGANFDAIKENELIAWQLTDASEKIQPMDAFSQKGGKLNVVSSHPYVNKKSLSLILPPGFSWSQTVELTRGDYMFQMDVKTIKGSGKFLIAKNGDEVESRIITVSPTGDWQEVGIFLPVTEDRTKLTFSLKSSETSEFIINFISLHPVIKKDYPPLTTVDSHEEFPTFLRKNGAWVKNENSVSNPDQKQTDKGQTLTSTDIHPWNGPGKIYVSAQALQILRQQGMDKTYLLNHAKAVVDELGRLTGKRLDPLQMAENDFDEDGPPTCAGLALSWPTEYCHEIPPLLIVYRRDFVGGANSNYYFLHVTIRSDYVVRDKVLTHELAHAYGFKGHYDDYYTIGKNLVSSKLYDSPYLYTDLMGLAKEIGHEGNLGEHVIETLKRTVVGNLQTRVNGPLTGNLPRETTLLVDGRPLANADVVFYHNKSSGEHLASYIPGDDPINFQTNEHGTMTINNVNSRYWSWIYFITANITIGDQKKSYYGFYDTALANLALWKNQPFSVDLHEDDGVTINITSPKDLESRDWKGLNVCQQFEIQGSIVPPEQIRSYSISYLDTSTGIPKPVLLKTYNSSPNGSVIADAEVMQKFWRDPFIFNRLTHCSYCSLYALFTVDVESINGVKSSDSVRTLTKEFNDHGNLCVYTQDGGRQVNWASPYTEFAGDFRLDILHSDGNTVLSRIIPRTQTRWEFSANEWSQLADGKYTAKVCNFTSYQPEALCGSWIFSKGQSGEDPVPSIPVTTSAPFYPSPSPTPLPQFGQCGSCVDLQGCYPGSECRRVNDAKLCAENNKSGTSCCLHDKSCEPGYKSQCGYADPTFYCNKCEKFDPGNTQSHCSAFQLDCGAGAPAKVRIKSPENGITYTSFSPITFSWANYGEDQPLRCSEPLTDSWAKWEDCRDPKQTYWNSPPSCFPETNDTDPTDRSCWGFVCAKGSFGILPEWRFYKLMLQRPDDQAFHEVCTLQGVPNLSTFYAKLPDQYKQCAFTPTKNGTYSWKVVSGYIVPGTSGSIFTNSTDSDVRSFTLSAYQENRAPTPTNTPDAFPKIVPHAGLRIVANEGTSQSYELPKSDNAHVRIDVPLSFSFAGTDDKQIEAMSLWVRENSAPASSSSPNNNPSTGWVQIGRTKEDCPSTNGACFFHESNWYSTTTLLPGYKYVFAANIFDHKRPKTGEHFGLTGNGMLPQQTIDCSPTSAFCFDSNLTFSLTLDSQ